MTVTELGRRATRTHSVGELADLHQHVLDQQLIQDESEFWFSRLPDNNVYQLTV